MATGAMTGFPAPSRLAEILEACGVTDADALLLVDRRTVAALWASASALAILDVTNADGAASALFEGSGGPVHAARLRRLADASGFRLERMAIPGRATPAVVALFPVADPTRPMALLHLRGAAAAASDRRDDGLGQAPSLPAMPDQAGAPTRVLWETDAAGRFTRIGPEIRVLGAAAPQVGDDLPAVLRPIDPALADRFAEAAASGGSVGRARIAWPVAASAPLAVEIGCTAARGGGPGLRGFLAVHGGAAPEAPVEEKPEPPFENACPAPAAAETEVPPEAAEEPANAAEPVPDALPAIADAPVGPTAPLGGNIVHFPMMRLGPVPANFGADLRPAAPAEVAAEPTIELAVPRWAEAPPSVPEPDPAFEGLSDDERDAFEHIRKVLGTRPFSPRPPASDGPGVPPDVAALLDRVPVALRFESRGAAHLNPMLRERVGDKVLPADLRGIPGAESVSFDFAGAPAMLTILRPDANPAGPRTAPESAVDVLDLVTDGHLRIDEAGIVRGVSAKAGRLLGSDAALVGRPFANLLADGQGPVWQAMAAAASGPEAPTQGPSPVRLRAAGQVATMLVRLARWEGALLCVLTVDRPAAPANDTAQAAQREAERTSALKSEFLAKVSHEIRTPLNAILGFAEVIRDERLGPVGNARYLEYLRDIHASGTHVMSLVNDLLDLSRIEAGRMDLNLAAVDANAVVQSCVNILQTQAHRERVIVRLSLTPRLPHALADERSLRQIVLNLLSNAIKFNEPGGQVIVSTALSGPHAVAIRIRDTGIGMSEEEIEAAMEPFRQISTVNRTGSGLGLPLTKALVEANCASMSIKSTRGEGTLVEVTFPLVEQGTVSLPAE